MPAPSRGRLRIILVAVAGCALGLAAAWFSLLAVFPPARVAALIGAEVKRVTGRDLDIGGDLSFRLFPALAVVADDIALGNAGWGTRAAMVTVRRAAFVVALRPLLEGQIRVLRIELEGADALLESDGKGRFNWEFGNDVVPAKGTGALAPVIGLDDVALTGARIVLRDGARGTLREVAIETLRAERQGDGLQFSAALDVARRLWRVEGRIGLLVDLAGRAVDWPFDLHLSTDGARLSAAGSINTGGHAGTARAEVSVLISSAAVLADLAGTTTLPLPVEIKATLARSGNVLSADPLQASLAGQELGGRLAMRSGDGDPRVEGRLSSPVIDVARWLGEKPAPVAPIRGQGALFGDVPLRFDALPSLPLLIDFEVERLLVPDAPPLAAVKGRVESGPERFALAPLSFAMADGEVDGHFEIARHGGEPPQTTLTITGKGLSAEALGALSGHGRHLRGGRADLKANLTLKGATPRDMAASANGDVLVSIRNTVVAGGASWLERNLLAALLQALAPGLPAQQALDIECAVVRLPLRHGVARIDRSIAMETRRVAISASGEVNLARQDLTLVFQPQAKEGLGLDEAGLARLVMLKGPLLDPEIGVDVKGAAREAASLGVAVATGGLSLLAGRMLGERRHADACRMAAGRE